MDDVQDVFLGRGEVFGASSFSEAKFEWTNFRLDVMGYTHTHFVRFLIKPMGSFANRLAPTEVLEPFVFFCKN